MTGEKHSLGNRQLSVTLVIRQANLQVVLFLVLLQGIWLPPVSCLVVASCSTTFQKCVCNVKKSMHDDSFSVAFSDTG